MRYELGTTSATPPWRSSSDSAAPTRHLDGGGALVVRAVRHHGLRQDGHRNGGHRGVLYGSTDLDTSSDPHATFLWITDDPALNRQTRGRMLESSELLTPWSLREVDDSFPDADLAPGRVYFLNTQKLSRTSRLVQCGTNVREVSFWDVLAQHHRGRPRATWSWCWMRRIGA